MKLSKESIIVISLVLTIGGLCAAFYFSIFTTVQSKINRTGTHKAKLIRLDGIDVNFRIQIDGQDVYYSHDFAPVDDDFREEIAWDRTGNIVVLEVAGKRLFGYDAEQQRQLSDDELLSVEYTPFSEYRYEGKLPEGSIR